MPNHLSEGLSLHKDSDGLVVNLTHESWTDWLISGGRVMVFSPFVCLLRMHLDSRGRERASAGAVRRSVFRTHLRVSRVSASLLSRMSNRMDYVVYAHVLHVWVR